MTSTADVSSAARATTWEPVCRLDDVQPERGVCAVVAGRQVAIVRTYDDDLYAVSQRDPFSEAFVLSRGIVGTRTVDGAIVPVLQSPMFKQAFDLRTGQCLDDASVRVTTYAVRQRDGFVEVGPGDS